MKWRRSSDAQLDLANLLNHIAEKQHRPFAAGQVLDRIEAAEQRLLTHPLLGRAGAFPDVYEYTMPRDPICLVYRISGDTLELLNVFHESLPPELKYR